MQLEIGSIPRKASDRSVRDEENVKAIPTHYRGHFLKARAGKCSPRQAIKAKCYSCCGYEDLRTRVSECSVELCPLWAFRPFGRGK